MKVKKILTVAILAIALSGNIIAKTNTTPNCDAPAAPGVNWSGCNKIGLRFSNVDLRGANLESTDLTGSFFVDANLEGANLQYAKMNKVSLMKTNLTLANLTGSDLRLVEFKDTISIRQAIFNNADLRGVNLSKKDLRSTSFIGAQMQNINLYAANLESSNLNDANLSKARLIRAKLKNASLIKTNLTGAELIQAQLFGVTMDQANLSNANMSGVVMDMANLRGANFESANLTKANIVKSDLSFSDLCSASFNDATIKNSIFKTVNAIPSPSCKLILNNAKIDYTDFSGAILNNAEMISTKLENITFSGTSSIQNVNLFHSSIKNCTCNNANFYGSNMEDITIIGSNFTKAILDNVYFGNNASFYNVSFVLSSMLGTTRVDRINYQIFVNYENAKGAINWSIIPRFAICLRPVNPGTIPVLETFGMRRAEAIKFSIDCMRWYYFG